MTINATDFSLVLSGGSSNSDVNLSLGGSPSNKPVNNNALNNLFDNVSGNESDEGLVDYRCLYLFNDGNVPVYNVQLWVENYNSGTNMQIGFVNRNEIQRITISSDVSGGNLNLILSNTLVSIPYNTDIGQFATAIQTAIRDIGGYSSATVSSSLSTNLYLIFDITFSDIDGSRTIDLIQIDNGNVAGGLTPSQVSVTNTSLVSGAPINIISGSIENETTPPGGVTFFPSTSIEPAMIPKLNPSDGFPFWIKRTILPDSIAAENDGFKLRIAAQTLTS